MTVRVVRISERIQAVEYTRDELEVRSLVVGGDDFTLIIDSLDNPRAWDPLKNDLGIEKPLLVVNSHADWDHWWGNAAFPGVPVIAHRLTRERQIRDGERELRARRAENSYFEGFELRRATVGFEHQLTIDLGGISVELHLLSGHTEDSTVAWVPQEHLLFGADAVEDPIPLLGGSETDSWADLLDEWSSLAQTVVPSHGAVSGPELLRRNASYLRGLSDPNRRVSELEDANRFYREAHARNVEIVGRATS